MMKAISFILFLYCSYFSALAQMQQGYFDLSWDDSDGKLFLLVSADQLDQDFLYVNALAAGVGSNDIGLDRGQLGDGRVVYFKKMGNKLMLMQHNLDYRAQSDNAEEVLAVQEAFAQSVVWSFPIKDQANAPYRIDMTPFLLRDAHDVSGTLKSRKQGAYKLDVARSAVWMERTKSFPDNTEMEAMLTFGGEPKGRYIRSVAADSKSITVRQHHSFIKLPDDGYKPRAFHPYSGFQPVSFADYASPIGEDMIVRYIKRHRLEKKNPEADTSEAVEPIVYYIDRGCPEPVKSALIEGASWWDQAYQAAGFAPGTFSVKELPADADPLDVRYNMIQWIHRSTRGWSYGASVIDPRTGEILKGHVSLGSLRVRQDYMIAQGLLSPYGNAQSDTLAMQMALARLRQLSAHEVGHTIGLAHNFASSTNDRASVMDYPHPIVYLAGKKLDFSQAYDDEIGIWDKRTIIYGYADYPDYVDEPTELANTIKETKNLGLRYITDRDARPQGGLHAYAHLWDNGGDIIGELERMLVLRQDALERFGSASIKANTPFSELEKTLVPLYLMHRYQAEAVTKLIGGADYGYSIKGEDEIEISEVSKDDQISATKALLATLSSDALQLSKSITDQIPPSAFGFGRSRESFKSHTGMSFDPMAAAEGYINDIIALMLNPERLARLQRNSALSASGFDLDSYLNMLDKQFSFANDDIQRLVQKAYFLNLIKLNADHDADYLIKERIAVSLMKLTGRNEYFQSLYKQSMDNPKEFQLPELISMPPGSPIGCGHGH